jgi:hypothetical protein
MATPHPAFRTRTRDRHEPARAARDTCRVEVLENTLLAENEQLAAAVEDEARRLLRGEAFGELRLRVKACRDDEDRLRFVCKVETPPQVEVELTPPWRWWSGLLDSAEGFTSALGEALRARRDRMGVAAR